jgi:hypothetical protein
MSLTSPSCKDFSALFKLFFVLFGLEALFLEPKLLMLNLEEALLVLFVDFLLASDASSAAWSGWRWLSLGVSFVTISDAISFSSFAFSSVNISFFYHNTIGGAARNGHD